MTQVPQELIEKLAARGIVPGARCRSAVTDKEEVLPPYEHWAVRHYDELVFADVICLHSPVGERFATVIEPAPGVKPDGLMNEAYHQAVLAATEPGRARYLQCMPQARKWAADTGVITLNKTYTVDDPEMKQAEAVIEAYAKGMAAGLTTDKVMEAPQEHITEEGWAMTEPNRWRLRARLAAIEANTTKP